MSNKRRLSKKRKEELLSDSGTIGNCAELLDVAVKAYYGEHASIKEKKSGYSLVASGMTAKELKFIRQLFGDIVVVEGGPRDGKVPRAAHAEGRLEVLRENVELEIFETIECFNEDWVVMSWRRPRCGRAFFDIAVSSDESGAALVLDWIDTINALFRSNRVSRS